ncbi:MAG: alanine--glyoxylate aminotransferase family protein [Bdellovibrionales bacterium]|nr:alanine--glyoxylate aminotransferase family protein [Bdellovibrionales bacterium]
MGGMNDWPYRLLAPGPVPMPPEVYQALSEPMIHHRTPEFEKILARVLSRLPQIFETQNPVMLLNCVGSGAMEAAVVNTLSPGDEVISINAGKFGERWSKLAEAFGYINHEIQVEWGKSVDVNQVEEALKKHPNARAVLVQVSETSTGALHPIQEIASLTRNRNVLTIADAITAIGVVELPTDKWGVDVVIGGSQKAFMLPPGLGFVSFSEKAWKFYEEAKTPRFYWDLKSELKSNKDNQTRFTSSVSLIRALDVVLDRLLDIGLTNYQSYVLGLANSLKMGAQTLGFEVFPENPSPALSAFKVPSGVDGKSLRGQLEKKFNITTAGGQDQLVGKILRVGHMGYIKKIDAAKVIEAIGLLMNEQGLNPNIAEAIEAVNQNFPAEVF